MDELKRYMHELIIDEGVSQHSVAGGGDQCTPKPAKIFAILNKSRQSNKAIYYKRHHYGRATVRLQTGYPGNEFVSLFRPLHNMSRNVQHTHFSIVFSNTQRVRSDQLFASGR